MAHHSFALFERGLLNFTDPRPIQIDSSLERYFPFIVSAVVETGLFGLLLILVPLTLYVLVKRPEQSSLSSSTYTDKIVTIVCGAQFCATTAVKWDSPHIINEILTPFLKHWILNLKFAFSILLGSAHTTYTISVENGQLRILEQTPSYLDNDNFLTLYAPLYAKFGLITIQLFLGDCLIVCDIFLRIFILRDGTKHRYTGCALCGCAARELSFSLSFQ